MNTHGPVALQQGGQGCSFDQLAMLMRAALASSMRPRMAALLASSGLLARLVEAQLAPETEPVSSSSMSGSSADDDAEVKSLAPLLA